MAYAMVSKYGMSDKIGYVGYVEGDYNKSYSDATNKVNYQKLNSLKNYQLLVLQEIYKQEVN